MWSPTLGDPHRYLVESLARRRVGLLAVELAEHVGVSDDAARKFLHRLLEEGTLTRPGIRRRRPEVHGSAARGGGGFMFFAARRNGHWYERQESLERGLRVPGRRRRVRVRARTRL